MICIGKTKCTSERGLLLNNWRPKDNFRFDPISDRQEKNHLVCNYFCAAIFVLLFLYFKSRGQISRVTCRVVTRLPASGKLVPSTLRWMVPVFRTWKVWWRPRTSRARFASEIWNTEKAKQIWGHKNYYLPGVFFLSVRVWMKTKVVFWALVVKKFSIL